MRLAKNMHSDPMKVQIASFRLSSPVEVACSAPCGTSWATAVTASSSQVVNGQDHPAGSNAQRYTPKNSSTTEATTGHAPALSWPSNISVTKTAVTPTAVTRGQYEGLGR